MDQLLNLGVGYGHQPFMNDPEDHRSDEEKMRDGCIGIIVSWIVIIVFFCIMACMSSCSASKSSCGVTVADADSLSHEVELTASVVQKDTTATQSAMVFNSSAVISADSEETEMETITEQITVTTEGIGRTTTTTNRTTTRQRKSNVSTQSLLDKYKEEVDTHLRLSFLDSVAASRENGVITHWHDSIGQQAEKHSDTAHVSTLAIIVDWMFRILGCVVFGIVTFFFVKYCKAK